MKPTQTIVNALQRNLRKQHFGRRFIGSCQIT